MIHPEARNFSEARAIITEGLDRRAFPAAVVSVGQTDGVLWHEAFGRLTYADDAPPCTLETIFDLASLTKVIATASVAMKQVSAGALRLNAPVSTILSGFSGGRRSEITIQQLLDHSSGLPASARLFEQTGGREGFARAICDLPLERAPGGSSVYSDVGFMLLGLCLESTGAGALDEQFRATVDTQPEPLVYCPPPTLWSRTAPTEDDPWRGRVLQGEVHDENAAAMGGVAAHAGLFATGAAVGAFARLVLRTLQHSTDLGTMETMRLFATRTGVPGSSRALGWDTALPTSSCGTKMSPHAIGHTGFTGTSLWIDPDRDLYAVLLTNRVHPTRANEQLVALRPRFHDALPF